MVLSRRQAGHREGAWEHWHRETDTVTGLEMAHWMPETLVEGPQTTTKDIYQACCLSGLATDSSQDCSAHV